MSVVDFLNDYQAPRYIRSSYVARYSEGSEVQLDR